MVPKWLPLIVLEKIFIETSGPGSSKITAIVTNTKTTYYNWVAEFQMLSHSEHSNVASGKGTKPQPYVCMSGKMAWVFNRSVESFHVRHRA